MAEGVETPPQVAFLRQHGCDAIQGYLASPPGDAERIGQLLAHAQPLLPPLSAGRADSGDDQGRRAEAGRAAAGSLRPPHQQPAPTSPEVPGGPEMPDDVAGMLAGVAPSAS